MDFTTAELVVIRKRLNREEVDPSSLPILWDAMDKLDILIDRGLGFDS